LPAGHTYAFLTSNAANTNPTATADTYIYALSSSGATVGSVLAEDDDGTGTFLSRLLFAPQTSGIYVIRLRAFGEGDSGTCDLAVTDLGAVPPITPRT